MLWLKFKIAKGKVIKFIHISETLNTRLLQGEKVTLPTHKKSSNPKSMLQHTYMAAKHRQSVEGKENSRLQKFRLSPSTQTVSQYHTINPACRRPPPTTPSHAHGQATSIPLSKFT